VTVSRLPWLLLFVASDALAGGYFFPDSGVVATGRGGAFIASADDTFAQYYNPGALSRLDRWTIDLGVSGVQQSLSFDRMMDDGTFAGTVSNEGGMFVVPQIGVGGPLIEDKLHMAVGLYTGYAPSFAYEEEGPQRYTLQDSLIWQAFAGPSVSYSPIPQLSIGVGLQWQFLRVEQQLTVSTTGGDNPGSDVDVSVKQSDPFAPSANFGLLIKPVDALSIGLTLQLPSSFDANGSMTADFRGSAIEDLLVETQIQDDSVRLGLNMPLIVKAGVAVHPSDDAVIELAMVYEQWSSLTELALSEIDLEVTFENPDFPAPEVERTLSLPAGLRDVVSLRLGGSVDVIDELTLRAGGFYETGSQRDDQLNVGLYDPAKFQLSGGTSVHLLDDRLHIDLSVANIFFASRDVRDSTVEQVVLQQGDNFVPSVVGNGDYRSNGFVLAGGVSWSFGKG
jgi:long-subunit fatty acid transport protein